MSYAKKKYYRKNTDLFDLIQKIKLWPSRSGRLHGIKAIEIRGDFAKITTHCQAVFIIRNSKKSRASRWIRNKWIVDSCKKCKIPLWKREKYNQTFFSSHYGSKLHKERG